MGRRRRQLIKTSVRFYRVFMVWETGVMASLTPEERFNRLEQVMQILAERQLAQEARQTTFEHIVTDLATEMRRGFDQVAIQFAETDRRMRQTDERIDKLVGAITELIRSQHRPLN